MLKIFTAYRKDTVDNYMTYILPDKINSSYLKIFHSKRNIHFFKIINNLKNDHMIKINNDSTSLIIHEVELLLNKKDQDSIIKTIESQLLSKNIDVYISSFSYSVLTHIKSRKQKILRYKDNIIKEIQY